MNTIVNSRPLITLNEEKGLLTTSGGVLTYKLLQNEVKLKFIKVTTPRKGIGSALIEALKDVARANRLPIKALAIPADTTSNGGGNVTISTADLQKFFEKLGFVNQENIYIWNYGY